MLAASGSREIKKGGLRNQLKFKNQNQHLSLMTVHFLSRSSRQEKGTMEGGQDEHPQGSERVGPAAFPSPSIRLSLKGRAFVDSSSPLCGSAGSAARPGYSGRSTPPPRGPPVARTAGNKCSPRPAWAHSQPCAPGRALPSGTETAGPAERVRCTEPSWKVPLFLGQ